MPKLLHRLFTHVTVFTIGLIIVSNALQAQTPFKPNTPPASQGEIEQAERQANGQFPTLKRGDIGGQIQETWNNAPAQSAHVTFAYCEGCTFKIRLRRNMVTLIELPNGETFTGVEVGDPSEFEVKKRASGLLAVKPSGYGVDSNIIVKGESGKTYVFYIRSENEKSKNLPDLFVKITGHIQTNKGKKNTYIDFSKEGKGKVIPISESGSETKTTTPTGDFIEHVAFDPSKLKGWNDYELWGDGDNTNNILPVSIYRDDRFTYIDYGDKWPEVELPTAYIVVDGIDEVVNTRVVDDVYIIESVNPLITLKSGTTFLCIKYSGKKS